MRFNKTIEYTSAVLHSKQGWKLCYIEMVTTAGDKSHQSNGEYAVRNKSFPMLRNGFVTFTFPVLILINYSLISLSKYL